MARWKQVPGWSRYEVSDEGQVRSKDMELEGRCGSSRIHKGQILRPVKVGDYLCVTLTSPETRRRFGIHQVVLLAFRGVATSYSIHTRHRDNNPLNNRLSNLRPGTAKQNSGDRVGHGTHHMGVQHPMARLTEVQARAIKLAPTMKEARILATECGIKYGQVYAIRTGKSWKHLK